MIFEDESGEEGENEGDGEESCWEDHPEEKWSRGRMVSATAKGESTGIEGKEGAGSLKEIVVVVMSKKKDVFDRLLADVDRCEQQEDSLYEENQRF